MQGIYRTTHKHGMFSVTKNMYRPSLNLDIVVIFISWLVLINKDQSCSSDHTFERKCGILHDY